MSELHVVATMTPKRHAGGYSQDCMCGWRGVLWSTEAAARDEFYAHASDWPRSLVEREMSTLRGRLGMARAAYEAAVIAFADAEREGRDVDAPNTRRGGEATE